MNGPMYDSNLSYMGPFYLIYWTLEYINESVGYVIVRGDAVFYNLSCKETN
jgi:hypothetical protein